MTSAQIGHTCPAVVCRALLYRQSRCQQSFASSTREEYLPGLKGSMAPVRKHDPTLPPPWEALYDDTQGVTYYWNPTTNVTTYDRPPGGPPVGVPPPVGSCLI